VALKGQRPKILWFDNSKGAEITSLAVIVERKLNELGIPPYRLDATILRGELNKDLLGTTADKDEELRRLIDVARICADAGLIVLVDSSLALQQGESHEDIEIVSSESGNEKVEEQAEDVIRLFF
jgi:adenylylsulfate kinase-like enzyme